MEFEVLSISELEHAKELSFRTRLVSSCVSPSVGGDLIVFEKFVLINRSVCLNCKSYETNVDYCRPVINYIFSKVDKSKIVDFESILNQFVIGKF